MIPQYKPTITEDDINAVCEYMKSGGWLTEHDKTTEFERMIADYTGSKYCVVVNNGTISLSLMALACGIKPGDEVIVPNYTMIATPNAMKFIGAVPVFVDVEPETLCLNDSLIATNITPKTKAVLFVSPNGRGPLYGINVLKALCEKHGLILLEDAAQSMGSRYSDGGSYIGTEGLCGSFSFSSQKIVTTGQGGAVVTNNEDVYLRLKKLKDFGRSGGGNDIHYSIGYNFKFTDLQAVVGLSQMEEVVLDVIRKRFIDHDYKKHIGKYMFNHEFHEVPWFIDGLFPQREELITYLRDHGIGTRRMYGPINKQRAYMDHPQHEEEFPVCERVGREGLWLPSSLDITRQEIKYVCRAVNDFYNLCKKY